MKLWLSGFALRAFASCACAVGVLLSAATAVAQQFVVTPVAEKKVEQLPAGPLYWRVENLPTLAEAKAAETPTSLAAEIDGKVWLFTLGPKGGSTAGATEVAEIGPVAPVSASEYLLRINHATGAPGVKTAVHTHPGSESFYILRGQLSQKTPKGTRQLDPGQSMPGYGPGTTMQVTSSGTSDLSALVMFVVDATKPFSTPSAFK